MRTWLRPLQVHLLLGEPAYAAALETVPFLTQLDLILYEDPEYYQRRICY